VTTRRTALGAALAGAWLLTGCDALQDEPAPSPGAGPQDADPDQALLDLVTVEVGEMLGLVTAARRRRSLAAPLADFATMHAAHLEVLGPPGGQTDRVRLAGSSGEVLARVLRRERESQRKLAGWSVDADSGQLARLLASMSAATAQRLAAGQPTGSGSGGSEAES
jgi:hypothetical protein